MYRIGENLKSCTGRLSRSSAPFSSGSEVLGADKLLAATPLWTRLPSARRAREAFALVILTLTASSEPSHPHF